MHRYLRTVGAAWPDCGPFDCRIRMPSKRIEGRKKNLFSSFENTAPSDPGDVERPNPLFFVCFLIVAYSANRICSSGMQIGMKGRATLI